MTSATPTRQTVLIVDDDHLIHELVETHLRALDLELLHAVNGAEALDRAGRERPDLVVLDIDMPGQSGLDVCLQLRREAGTKNIPVVFMTGSSDPATLERGFDSGAVDFVTKPFHGIELRARVAAALRTRELLARLETQASTDGLTGLPNRSALFEALCRRLDAGPDGDPIFTLLFLDIDRFKLINDSYGHRLGDELLLSVARRLRSVATQPGRDGNVLVSRLGGDEFVLLLGGSADTSEARRLAEDVLAAVAAPHVLGAERMSVTTSVGILVGDGTRSSPEDVLRDADIAMYHAKSSGGARHAFYREHMRIDVLQRLRLEQGLRRALERDRLELQYQPILSLQTGRTVGAEALVRWNDEERGRQMPESFITIAEETGIIAALGEWVLRTACAQLREWRETCRWLPQPSLCVNISRIQLLDPALPHLVETVLAENALDPGSLQLEITEAVLMQGPEIVAPALDRLSALGVKIALDDFGTGHSTLSCLNQFPIDVLKIDRAFVTSADMHREYAAINQAIITLAHNLGISVVAEGIETAGQLAQLQALDCDRGQGFYFCEPLDPADVRDFVNRRNDLARSARSRPTPQAR